MSKSMRRVMPLLVLALFCAATAVAQTQVWPSKPIRLIASYPAGGGIDITARALGAKLTERWGKPVIVDNRPGASGIIAMDMAMQAKDKARESLSNYSAATSRYVADKPVQSVLIAAAVGAAVALLVSTARNRNRY